MLFQKISNASPLFKAIRIVMVVFFLVSCTVLSPGQQTAWAEPGISPANILSDYSVPLRFGNIKESFTGANGKTIIHIQDAHCNYSAQH